MSHKPVTKLDCPAEYYDARPRLETVVQSLTHRVLERSQDEEAANLISAAYILMGLRYSRDVAAALFKGVRSMRESDTYQAILEEGEVKGEVKNARATLLRLGARRWGPPEQTARQRLEAIRDLAQLQELIDRVLDAPGWQELLAGR